MLEAGGFEGIGDEHGDGHGADAAGDWGDGGAARGDVGEVDIADDAVAVFGGWVGDAVDADVDDDGTVFDEVSGDEFRAADGGDEDIGVAADGGEVAGAGVGDGDGGVAAFAAGHEEEGEGFADDHGAADDDDAGSGGFDAVFDEEPLAAEGCAGDEGGGVFEGETGDILRVEAVDVFVWADGADDGGLVNVGWRGGLDEDAVDGGVGVEVGDDGEEIVLRGGGGESDVA